MPKHLFIQEAAKLAPKKSDGTYPIVIITEGEGSSGRYGSHLFEEGASEHVFENVGSYADHPIDPKKPHLRSVLTLAGRLSNVTVGEDRGKRALLADLKPRKEYEEFLDEFGDIVGMSIFCGAEGEVLEDGRLDVASFDAEDPYRSVDIVVAAGRGGRIKRAEESLRAIESSLGIPEGNKPAAEASAEEKEGERMDEKDIQAIAVATATAIAESLKPVLDFVNESAAAKGEKDQTEATAEALDDARTEGAKAAAESFKAIDAAELPEKITEALKAQVLEGKDVTEAVAAAKEVADAVAESADASEQPGGHVIESAGARRPAGASKGFALKGGRR